MTFIINSISVKGRLHDVNEDSFICNDGYIVIADGMGGEASGEVASNLAINTISSYLDDNLKSQCSENDYKTLAFSAISNADKAIANYIVSHPDAYGMGTTVLLLIRNGQTLYIAWCGDSRCYSYSPKMSLHSLTTDHSYVQQLIDENKISVDESYTHPDNNLVTRYVGGGADTCQPDFTTYYMEDDSIVILCSDGLSGYCRSNEIAKTVKNNRNIENLPKQLSELAILHGSDDDITIVIIIPKEYGCKHPTHSMLGWIKKLLNS